MLGPVRVRIESRLRLDAVVPSHPTDPPDGGDVRRNATCLQLVPHDRASRPGMSVRDKSPVTNEFCKVGLAADDAGFFCAREAAAQPASRAGPNARALAFAREGLTHGPAGRRGGPARWGPASGPERPLRPSEARGDFVAFPAQNVLRSTTHPTSFGPPRRSCGRPLSAQCLRAPPTRPVRSPG
jgi:hypothetical protein